MDTTELKAAYAAFLDAARKPAMAAGDWTPERVLAHIAVNDELLLAASSAVYAGTAVSYDNARAVDPEHLAYVEGNAEGSYELLLSAVRRGGEELVEVAERLTDEMAATVVPTRIVDGEELRVDAPLAWGDVLLTHARIHLPSHARQLAGEGEGDDDEN